MTIKGNVEKVTSSPTKTGKIVWAVHVGGTRYSCGFVNPGCGQGDLVEFETVQNGQYTNAGPITVLQKGASVNVVTGGGVSTRAISGGEGMGREQYWQRREERDVATQRRIQRQSSRNSAIEVVRTLLEAEAIKLPEGSKRHAVIAAAIEEWTEKFEADTDNLGTAEPAGESVAAAVPATTGETWS